MGLRYDRYGNAVYRSKRWKHVRFLVRRRDDFKCVKCGVAGCRLEVDHIEPIRKRPDLAYDMGNLQLLCVPCHSRKTRIEIGLDEQGDPRRQAWRKIVRDLAQSSPEKETGNAQIN